MTGVRKPKFFYGYVIIAAAFLIMVAVWGAYYSFGVFFKPLLSEFNWTRAVTSGAFSLCLMVEGLMGLVMGKLNDRFGPRLVVTACGLLLGLGYLLMSQASAVWHLYLFYGVMVGIGLSGSFIPLVSTVARWFAKRRGMMTGIILAGGGVGTMIMSPLANQFILAYGWRTAYTIVGIIALVSIGVAAQFLRYAPHQIGQVQYGADDVREGGTGLPPWGISLQEAAHTRQLWLISAMLFCWGFSVFAILVHVVAHTIELGISATSAAGILAIIGGSSVAIKIIMGSTADRIGNKPAFIIGLLSLVVSLLWLVVATELWMFYLFAIIFTLGYASGVALMSTIVAELFGTSSHGVILGVVNFSATIGCTVGPVLTGYIFDVTGSYQVAFLVCAAVSLIGLIITLFIKPIHRKKEAGS